MRGYSALFIIYSVIGFYLINLGAVYFEIPETFTFLNKWFLVVGGVLIVLSGFRWLRSRYYYRRY